MRKRKRHIWKKLKEIRMLPVSTSETCETILLDHRGTENPPTFLFKCLSGRQQREVLQTKNDLDKGKELEKFDGVFATVESYLVGWENIDIEYAPGELIEVVGYMQAMELLGSLVYQRPSDEDKKKSKSQSGSDTEKSVPPAKAD